MRQWNDLAVLHVFCGFIATLGVLRGEPVLVLIGLAAEIAAQVLERWDRREAGASANARPQAPGAQRRNSAEDEGADAASKGKQP